MFQVIQADFGQGQTLLNSLNNLRTHKVLVSMASRNYHRCCLCTHDRQEPGLLGNNNSVTVNCSVIMCSELLWHRGINKIYKGGVPSLWGLNIYYHEMM